MTAAAAETYVTTTTLITLTCLATKQWDRALPNCRRRLCGPPPTVNGSDVTFTGMQYSDVAVYTAHQGYRLFGTALITCSKDRTWQPENNPIASAVACPLPELGQNSRWTTKSLGIINSICVVNGTETFCPYDGLGDLVQECEPGYHAVGGTTNRTCQDDKSFSGSPLVCIELTCPAVKQTSSLLVSESDNSIGSKLTSQCARGYIDSGVGDIDRVCQIDGHWSGTQRICQREFLL